MEIDPRRLRFLLAVARAGGVLAAADELRVTPSAVSQQLARLEREVGRSLVRRTSTGTVLTEVGRDLADTAEEIERSLEAARVRLSEDDGDPSGTVRIGGFHSFLSVILLPALPGWRERFPRLRFEVVEDEEEDLVRRLRSGDLDAVVLELDAEESSRALPARVTEVPLLDEPWKVIVPAGTITSTESVDLARLGLPWLGVAPTAAGAQALRRVRRTSGSAVPTAHVYTETQTALAFVAAGEGAAIIPSLALRGITQAGVETLDAPGLGMRRIVLRRHEGRGVPRVVDVATTLIRDAASAFSFDAAP
ncbi:MULTISPECIES: LysR family transcriptional regulator [unclassified Nocardioides]|uniref:LysR family transcriptional regulator n=1 Tax=unclassified Nocardioides TaxID=2615069 RepID=UPI0030145899